MKKLKLNWNTFSVLKDIIVDTLQCFSYGFAMQSFMFIKKFLLLWKTSFWTVSLNLTSTEAQLKILPIQPKKNIRFNKDISLVNAQIRLTTIFETLQRQLLTWREKKEKEN